MQTLCRYPRATAATVSRQYAFRFPHGPSLADRVAELLAKYPNVSAPSWISWEGGALTNCQTSDRLRALYAALTGD